MIIRRWGSLLLAIALWLSVGIFIKRYNFELLGELKAFLTVLFGLATSFLLLSFVWLLQKKPLDGNWSSLQTNDFPSMHPRGRSDSTGSVGDFRRRPTVCTVSSMFDQPPNYEDALINSKPVNWTYLPIEKASHNCHLESTSTEIDSSTPLAHICPHSKQTSGSMNQTTSGECCLCMNGLCSEKIINHKSSQPTNSVTQLALTIVRGFTTLDSNTQSQQTVNQPREDLDSRKISYSQLDVSQLMLSGSPPKYKELIFGGMIDESTGNTINESSIGERV